MFGKFCTCPAEPQYRLQDGDLLSQRPTHNNVFHKDTEVIDVVP